MMVRNDEIIKLVNELKKLDFAVIFVTNEKQLREVMSQNKIKILEDISNLKKAWINFVPLQKTIKVIARSLKPPEINAIEKFALDDEALKEVRSQYGQL